MISALLGMSSWVMAQDSLRLTINLEGFKKNDEVTLYFNDSGYGLEPGAKQLHHTNYLDGPQELVIAFKSKVKRFWMENGDIILTISKSNFWKGSKIEGSKSELLYQSILSADRTERARLLEANIDHAVVIDYMRRHNADLNADDMARIRAKMPSEVNEFAQYHLGIIEIDRSEVLKEGDFMMDFVAMTADDTKVDTKALRGKYLLLDFAGTGCSWCWVTYPQMARDLVHYKNLSVLTFNEDYLIEGWAKRAERRDVSLPWPVLWKAENKEDIFKTYGVNVLPTYLLISPEGKILERWQAGKDKRIIKMLTRYNVE